MDCVFRKAIWHKICAKSNKCSAVIIPNEQLKSEWMENWKYSCIINSLLYLIFKVWWLSKDCMFLKAFDNSERIVQVANNFHSCINLLSDVFLCTKLL